MPVYSMMFSEEPSSEEISRSASSSRRVSRPRCKAVVSTQAQETEYTTTRGQALVAGNRPVPDQELIYSRLHHHSSIPSFVNKHRQKGRVPTSVMWPSSDRQRRQPKATSNPTGRGPLTSSSKEPTGMARSHGRLRWTQESVGGKCTRRKTWGRRHAKDEAGPVCPASGHCATRSDMAQHHALPMGVYPSANGIQSARVG